MVDTHDEADRPDAIRARLRLEEMLNALNQGSAPTPITGIDPAFVRLIASLGQIPEELRDDEATSTSITVLSSLTLDYVTEILEEVFPLIHSSNPLVQAKFLHALDRGREQFGH